jgi:hypothetical protein
LAIFLIDGVGPALIVVARIQHFDASFALELACLTSSKDVLTLADTSYWLDLDTQKKIYKYLH